MAKTLDTTIELARYFDTNGDKKKITIADYNGYVDSQDRTFIADFIFQRLQSRYLKPFSLQTQNLLNSSKMDFQLWQIVVC